MYPSEKVDQLRTLADFSHLKTHAHKWSSMHGICTDTLNLSTWTMFDSLLIEACSAHRSAMKTAPMQPGKGLYQKFSLGKLNCLISTTLGTIGLAVLVIVARTAQAARTARRSA